VIARRVTALAQAIAGRKVAPRMERIDEMAGLLKKLAELCDTGFALAIHIRYTRPSLFFQTYAQEWIDYYSENGLMLYDPVVKWGLLNTGMVAWSELEGDDPRDVLGQSAKHGLHNGIALGIGPATSRTIAGLTRSGPAFSEEEIAQMVALVTKIHTLTESLVGTETPEMDEMRKLQLSEY